MSLQRASKRTVTFTFKQSKIVKSYRKNSPLDLCTDQNIVTGIKEAFVKAAEDEQRKEYEEAENNNNSNNNNLL